ncbi:MAG: DUF167 domain-containing protein [Candidatus Cryosericum sp.]|jgi:uncharacterized protein
MQIRVHVIPGSSRSDAEPGDPWRVHVHAKPTEGKANEELLQVISRHFGVARSAVRIVGGHASRSKTVEIGLEGPTMKGETR